MRGVGVGIMKLMIDIATSVCWTIFNLSAASCSEILKFFFLFCTNFRNTCLEATYIFFFSPRCGTLGVVM